METVRVTAPDLQRRAALEKTRARLVMAAAGFAVLFGAVAMKLALATVLDPVQPKPVAQMRKPEPPPPAPAKSAIVPASMDLGLRARRAMIVDRNGEILAVSLPTAGVFANPREVADAAEAARQLKTVVPQIDEDVARERLSDQSKQFVYLARQITPREELSLNALGIPGIDFTSTERRRYPLGRVAAQVLGGVDVDGKGVAGVERFFDERLREDPEPLRLSIDVRVQAVVRDELSKAMEEFQAIGACGVVMDVNTGEMLAMVSLPDYDANDVGHATPEERFNRAVTGMYEPGSTFKLQTAAMALDSGAVGLWNQFNAAEPIHRGRFTITDFEGKHRWLYLPEVLAYSSNLGAAHIAETVGSERQRAWLGHMGMFSRIGIELPEAGLPIVPSVQAWKELVTMTVGFGHGIAVSPLHVVRGTAAIANSGIVLRPTILALPPGAPPRQGERVMQQATSDLMRRLMRLVVTDGYGKPADVPGYFVGGKTGTAEKVGGKGYKKHANVSAFMSVFPMNAPRYAVYMMLDEPKADASTHGYATAGWVSAPAAGRVIARIGPMLGLLPETDNAPAIQAALSIPLQPPGRAAAKPGAPEASGHPAPRPAGPVAPATPFAPAEAPAAPVRDLRHEASLQVPALVPQ
jgi:cell division protein FtsI (penicillin-binding protein 3)